MTKTAPTYSVMFSAMGSSTTASAAVASPVIGSPASDTSLTGTNLATCNDLETFARHLSPESSAAKLVRGMWRSPQQRPAATKEFIRHFHQGDMDHLPHFDRFLDLLLNLDHERTEWAFEQSGIALTPRIRSERYEYGESYNTPYALISAVLHYVNPGPNDVFYDLGSGYGRPTIFTGIVTKAKVIGVEMMTHRVVKTNTAKERLGLNNVEYRRGLVNDASMDFGNGTIFFLFNPFKPDTLQEVIEQLKSVARGKATRQETIRIASFGFCTDAFECEKDWLRFTHRVGSAYIFESY